MPVEFLYIVIYIHAEQRNILKYHSDLRDSWKPVTQRQSLFKQSLCFFLTYHYFFCFLFTLLELAWYHNFIFFTCVFYSSLYIGFLSFFYISKVYMITWTIIVIIDFRFLHFSNRHACPSCACPSQRFLFADNALPAKFILSFSFAS